LQYAKKQKKGFILMKKSTFKKFVAFALVVMMLASTCVVNTVFASSANYAEGKSYTVSGAFLGGKADDGVMLTDGVIPGAEISGSTVAFSGTGAVNVVTIDLASTYDDISKIIVGGVVIAGNRQYGAAVIEVSADGENFTAVTGSVETSEVIEGTTTNNFIYNFDAVSAQFVRVTITSANYVLTIGDIQVYGADAESDDTTSDDTTSDDTTSDDTTSDDTTSDDTTSDDTTSDDTTSDDTTSDDTTSDDTTSDDTTSDEEPGKPGDKGIVAFVVLAILSLAAVVVCKKVRRA